MMTRCATQVVASEAVFSFEPLKIVEKYIKYFEIERQSSETTTPDES